MSSPHSLSPTVAKRLAELACELRQEIYGGQGIPEWGTKFAAIEAEGMDLGLELARLFMQQSVEDQAGEVPPQALENLGDQQETIPPGNRTHKTTLETPAGEVQWKQPRTRLPQARRDFFPSGESAGDCRR